MSQFLSLTIALFALLVTPGTLPAASVNETARQILRETGVSGGLIVHVHCGDGQLTAALSDNLNEDEAQATIGLPDTQKQLAEFAAALLHAVSADTGKRLAEYQLDALPVFDGMAAVGGNLFIVDKGGKVTCFTDK